MDTVNDGAARVARVNGPLVEVTGLTGVAMYDIVELGAHRLPGEAVAIRGDVTTVQAYEYTGGLAPGHPARSRGEPLSARLGPHLLGGIFDGLLRPLSGAPAWLEPGFAFDPRRTGSSSSRRSRRRAPPSARAPRLGSVAVAGGIGYRVLVPPGLSGTVEKMREAGRRRRRGDRDRLRHGRAPDFGVAGAASPAVPARGSTPARRCSPGSG